MSEQNNEMIKLNQEYSQALLEIGQAVNEKHTLYERIDKLDINIRKLNNKIDGLAKKAQSIQANTLIPQPSEPVSSNETTEAETKS